MGGGYGEDGWIPFWPIGELREVVRRVRFSVEWRIANGGELRPGLSTFEALTFSYWDQMEVAGREVLMEAVT